MTGWDCQSKRIFSPDCFDPNPSKNQGGIAVIQAVYDARGNGDGKTVCTITGDHQNRVTDYTALCIGNGQTNQSIDDKAGALNCMHDQQAVMNQSVVRRLTPLEAERLQGYPDGWTDIGEWVDSKGKKHKPADSPRHKALGNSIALPFWFWLLRRISAQYYWPATLGSLFDGISGFCYVWARCNGSKSCLWASEIEEFPIAVCKRHFGDEESGEVGDILEYL
jgi:DNA (cytosine-5)-methyltransferase 1